MGTSLLIIGYAHPLPWKLITKFISDHTFVLVAEEPEPFIEGQLVASLKVKGRLTGHLPYGPLERSDLEQAIKEISLPGRHQVQGYETAKKRGSRSLCDDCPYLPLFRVLRRLEVPVSGDAGCSILATREPFRAVDVVYGLGSSIGVASGFRRKGIAVIGDFAFAHSGLLGLINAVWCKRNVLVVLLKNDVAATTGGQEVPDLSFILETLVPTRRLSMPASEDVVEQMLQEELSSPRASAVVAEGRCTRYG
jgi:indolepyruvate ferredoxin oxidoreductase alpha subunit